ncbi:MAG: cytochrome c [Archangiaceae bacterium]|nr:cytochrome c [Archangiaceae bacterium]
MKTMLKWCAVGLLAGCMQRETRDDPGAKSETFTQQAEAGGKLYGESCAGCHGDSGQGTEKAPRVVGLSEGALPLDPPPERKKRTTRFRTVADVAKFAVQYMPAKNPGSLPEADYWRILAFDLKANGIDLGDQHLDMALAETLEIPRAAKTSQR